MTAFDPYHHWLSIPPHEQPANYYRLLGIPLFEDDENVILNAADRQARYVMSQSVREHRSAAQQILNELSRAKDCLLDRDAKRAYDDALRSHVAPRSGGEVTTGLPPQQVEAKTPIIVPTVAVTRTNRRSFGAGYWIGHVIAGLGGLAIGYAILVRSPLWKKPPETTISSQEIQPGDELGAQKRATAVKSNEGRNKRPIQRVARTVTDTGRQRDAGSVETDASSERQTTAPRPADPREVMARFPRVLALPFVTSATPIELASLSGLHAVRLELDVVNSPIGQYTAREESAVSEPGNAAWNIVNAADQTVAELRQDPQQVSFRWNPTVSESDIELFTLSALCFHCETESRAICLREPVTADPLRLGPKHFVSIPLQLPESIWEHLRYEVAVPTPLPSEFRREPDEGERIFGHPTKFRAGAEDELRVEITVQPVNSNDSPVIRLTGEYFLGKSRERPLDRDRFKRQLQEVTSTVEEKLQDRVELVQQIAQLTSRLNLVRRATPRNAVEAAAKASTLAALEAAIRKNNERLASLDRTLERFKADQEALVKVSRWIDQLSFDELMHYRIYLPLEVHDDRLALNLVTSLPQPMLNESGSGRERSAGNLEDTDDDAALVAIDLEDDPMGSQAIGRIGPKVVPLPERRTEAIPQHEALLVRAEWAMGNADVELARQCLNEAFELPRSPESTREAERLRSLLGCVEQFWGAVEEGIQLISNSELRVNDEIVYVMQVENGRISFKQAGRLRRIRQDSLPPELALAIADRFFDHEALSTDVIRGAFFAVTPQFGTQGKSRALQLWTGVKRKQPESDEAWTAGELIALLENNGEST